MDKDQIINLRKLSQQYAYSSIKMHETIAKKAGFSSTEHKYLGFFLQKGSLTAGDLAKLTGLTTGAVTGLIDRFIKKGLVKRVFDKNDRRKVIIQPYSEKIVALFDPFYKDYQNQTDEIIKYYSIEEITIIESYLLKSIELMIMTHNKFNK